MRSARKFILQILAVMNACASLVARFNTKVDRIHEEIRLLGQQHPEYAYPNQRDAAAFMTYCVMVVCAYVLDAALVGSFAEFCATALFPHWPFVKTAVRFAIPLAFIGFEMGIAAQRHAAKIEAEEAAPGAPRSFAIMAWTLLGILWAALVPMIVFLVQRSAATLTFATAKVLVGLTPVLMAIALALHVAILFAGKLAHDAKGHIAFRLRLRKLRREAAKAARAGENARDTFHAAVVRYVHELESFNRFYPHRSIPAGPFTAEAKSLAEESFGRDFIGGTTPPEISPAPPLPVYPPQSLGGPIPTEPVAIQAGGKEDPA
jgi:hypothetical protein